MTTKTASKSILLTYGFLLGLLSISMSVILYLQDLHLAQNQAIGLLSVFFIIVFIALGIRAYSKSNALSFGAGLKIGMGITVLSAVMVSLYNYIFSTYIEPDFMNQMAEVQRQAMEASGELTAEQIDKRIEKLREGANSLITPAIGIVFSAFLGFVISAITTVIFIKIQENKNPE